MEIYVSEGWLQIFDESIRKHFIIFILNTYCIDGVDFPFTTKKTRFNIKNELNHVLKLEKIRSALACCGFASVVVVVHHILIILGIQAVALLLIFQSICVFFCVLVHTVADRLGCHTAIINSAFSSVIFCFFCISLVTGTRNSCFITYTCLVWI